MNKPIVAIARRLYSLIAYHTWANPIRRGTVKTKMLGFSLEIPPTVFHPRHYFTSKFLGEWLSGRSLGASTILDLGSGSGILSLVVASRGASVVAVDVNRAAVSATECNARRNGMSGRIVATESDMFDALDPAIQRYTHIVTNPPYYPGKAIDNVERAFKGGEDNEFFVRLAATARKFLRPGGSIIIVLTSDIDTRKVTALFEAAGYDSMIVKSKKLPFETLSIVELRPLGEPPSIGER